MNGWSISLGFGIAFLLAGALAAQGPYPPGGPIGQDPYFPRQNSNLGSSEPNQPPPAAAQPRGPEKELPLELFEPGKLVAKVGNLPIFYGEILGDLNQIVEQEMPDASATLKDLRRKELFEQLLPRMIEQKMIYADFLRKLPDESRLPEIMDQLDTGFYDSELPRLLDKVKVNSLAELDVKLRTMGSSVRNIKQAWKESQIVGYYIGEKFKEEKEVTHQEMLDYYRDHLSDYEIAARVRWEQLMVRFDQFPTKNAARVALEAMGNEVVFGAPLDAVAQRKSHGPMASMGGQYDWTSQGSMLNKKIEAELFRLRLNYLSDIIESEQGLHIVRVKEREPTFNRPFTEVQTEIKERLTSNERKEQIKKFLGSLQDEIPVWTILDEEADSATSASRKRFALPTR